MQTEVIQFKDLYAPEARNIRVDYGDIRELADSIRESGLQMPISVIQETPGKFRVIDGFRRMRALNLLNQEGTGINEIPVLIREMTETECLYLQFTGNSGRNIGPLEFGMLCQKLEEQGETVAEISRKTGKSRQYVDDCINLTFAPETVLEAIKSGEISGSAVIRQMKQTPELSELERVVSEARELVSGDNDQKPGKKVKLPASDNKKPGNGKAEAVILELFQLTGNEKLCLLLEAIEGNIPVSSLVIEFRN